MAEDIRIKSDFPNHFKTQKLIRIAGHAGFYSLMVLWCYCRINKPKGDLSGMSEMDIDIASNFNTDRIRSEYQALYPSFATCLHEAGYLDKLSDGNTERYSLHDWPEHQPWAFFASERSQKARESVKQRWSKRLENKQSNTKRIRNVKESNTKSNTPSPNPFPTPSPNPFPKKKKKNKDIKTPIPDKFQISDQVREWATKEGYSRLEARLAHFIDWAKAGDKRYLDWDATFRNAIRGDWAHLDNGKGAATVPEKPAYDMGETIRAEEKRMKEAGEWNT